MFFKKIWAKIKKPVAVIGIILFGIIFLAGIVGGLVVTAKPWVWPIGLCIVTIGILSLPGLFWLIGGLREWMR